MAIGRMLHGNIPDCIAIYQTGLPRPVPGFFPSGFQEQQGSLSRDRYRRGQKWQDASDSELPSLGFSSRFARSVMCDIMPKLANHPLDFPAHLEDSADAAPFPVPGSQLTSQSLDGEVRLLMD
jgi:hypothetical protein